MINNRQNGRRRGRGGGQRSPGGGQGQRDSGNRIDSRARGNAAQLLEKYKNMARDAQLSGDRVNTEYYLQFADHYFRVLADQRGRFEDQNRDRRPRDDFDDGDDFGDDNDIVRADEQQPRDEGRREERNWDRNGREERNAREDRNGRDRRFERRDENPRAAPAEPAREEAPAPVAAEESADNAAVEAPRPRRGRPRRNPLPETEQAEALGADRLPPSLGAVPPEGVIASEGEPVEAPKPRTRRRRTTDAEASAN